MYVGHFGIGLALKARYPAMAATPILVGVEFLDIVNGIFILLGWDHVHPDLQAGPYLYFDLTFIDWDHSLLTAAAWSAAWAALFLRDRRVAVLAFAAAFSHFLADWPVHRPDLALFPFSELHLGYGLWAKLGTLSWVLEGCFAAALTAYACVASPKGTVNWRWPCLVMLLLFISTAPALSPMRLVATLAEPAAHLAHGALGAVGALLPALLLIRLMRPRAA